MIPVKANANFVLLRRADGQFQIRCLDKSCAPNTVRITKNDANYLLGLKQDFGNACVLEFGCGWFTNKQ